jgi:hypothetical protein
MFRNVLFPEPEGPTIAALDPDSKVKLHPCRT